jgi:hypothetical protein
VTVRNDTAPDIEFLILANHAEAINGMLYLSGGGWTDHRRPVRAGMPPPTSHLGIAVGICAPWTGQDRTVTLEVDIETMDGTTKLAQVSGGLQMSAPPEEPPGGAQHAVIAINADVLFPQAGAYRISGRLTNGGSPRYWNFRVHDMPVNQMPTQQQGNA